MPDTIVLSPTPVRDLSPFFSPRSIAVVGASRKEGSVGHALVRNLIYGGYTGVIYPINPKAKGIQGIPCFPDLSAIGDPPDLVVVVVPAPFVERVVLQAADMGTRNVLVISAGFKEIGGEGLERENRLRSIARDNGVSILGPNCLGLINTDPTISMNATFGRDIPPHGTLGLISQSGALCAALLDYAKGRGIGFSQFVSFGNKCDVDEVDLLRSIAADPNTRAIMMYVEDVGSGPRFLEAAHEITHGPNPKPILVIKSGRTAEGAAAAASHTGSLAGSDQLYDALMTQAGAFRVETVAQLFDLAEIFTDPLLPAGKKTAIITNAGGPGIMATDACIRHGLELAKFRDYTVKSLQFQMPTVGSIKNPVDVIGDARHDRYRAALDAVTADDQVDQVLVIVTPQTMTDVTEIAHVIGETKEFCNKPMAACLMGLVDVSVGVDLLQKKYAVPTFAFPENAMRSMAAKTRFGQWVRSTVRGYHAFDVDKQGVVDLFDRELAAGRHNLIELKALEALQHYGFPTVRYQLATTADEAVAAAAELGYPVVMKISGPKILHKTDVGGVKLDLRDEAAVRTAYTTMLDSVRRGMGEDVEIWGVIIQQMLAPGKEVILGVTRDERFGPMLMCGLGGIYAETFRDVSFRLAPIRENVAREMIQSLRSVKLLEGVRGEPPSDIDAVAECLLRVSQFVTEHPRIAEMDINPLLVYPRGKGAMVADARIILRHESAGQEQAHA
ncbi:MAG: acetate--CoA ligase family protein [Pirellulaceae bacterium]|jgi:acetyltransferase|nr:acetate--CoA ligase family protein [Pirellulaceae bacterium]